MRTCPPKNQICKRYSEKQVANSGHSLSTGSKFRIINTWQHGFNPIRHFPSNTKECLFYPARRSSLCRLRFQVLKSKVGKQTSYKLCTCQWALKTTCFTACLIWFNNQYCVRLPERMWNTPAVIYWLFSFFFLRCVACTVSSSLSFSFMVFKLTMKCNFFFKKGNC